MQKMNTKRATAIVSCSTRKPRNQSTENFRADEITGVTFKASSSNFLFFFLISERMTIRHLANHVNYVPDSMDRVARTEGGKALCWLKRGRQAINDIWTGGFISPAIKNRSKWSDGLMAGVLPPPPVISPLIQKPKLLSAYLWKP